MSFFFFLSSFFFCVAKHYEACLRGTEASALCMGRKLAGGVWGAAVPPRTVGHLGPIREEEGEDGMGGGGWFKEG